jgi:hypothetical protein
LNTDVEPNLASEILFRIQNMLRTSRSVAQLNFEIVHPSTFQALEEHLARAENIHGPGYYHVVHLDMHGQLLSKDSTKPLGVLLFNHLKSDALKAHKARPVAKLLKRYHIPFVTLNACESARANSRDDANIAKIFVSEGIHNVLAMTFKVSSYAVSVLLGIFYHELLIHGSPFSSAATAGRSALKAELNRPARFGLQRELVDWFVPVIYSDGMELVLVGPIMDASCTLCSDGTVVRSALEKLNLSAVKTRSLMSNRDFDVLRLAKGSSNEGRPTYTPPPPGDWKNCSSQIRLDNLEGNCFGRCRGIF